MPALPFGEFYIPLSPSFFEQPLTHTSIPLRRVQTAALALSFAVLQAFGVLQDLLRALRAKQVPTAQLRELAPSALAYPALQ